MSMTNRAAIQAAIKAEMATKKGTRVKTHGATMKLEGSVKTRDRKGVLELAASQIEEVKVSEPKFELGEESTGSETASYTALGATTFLAGSISGGLADTASTTEEAVELAKTEGMEVYQEAAAIRKAKLEAATKAAADAKVSK